MKITEAAEIAIKNEERLTVCCGTPFLENSDLCSLCKDHATAEVMFEYHNNTHFAHFHVDHPNCYHLDFEDPY
jgi:hypothetical protein